MRDSELDRLDPGKIGRIHHVLTAGPGMGLLVQQPLQRTDHGIERPDHRQAQLGAAPLQPIADIQTCEGKQHQARIGRDITQNPFQMLLRTDHRPEVAHHVCAFALGQGGLGDHLERFAGGIRDEVDVKAGHGGGPGLWIEPCINHGTSLLTTLRA